MIFKIWKKNLIRWNYHVKNNNVSYYRPLFLFTSPYFVVTVILVYKLFIHLKLFSEFVLTRNDQPQKRNGTWKSDELYDQLRHKMYSQVHWRSNSSAFCAKYKLPSWYLSWIWSFSLLTLEHLHNIDRLFTVLWQPLVALRIAYIHPVEYTISMICFHYISAFLNLQNSLLTPL